jgi:hypothetical protein
MATTTKIAKWTTMMAEMLQLLLPIVNQ